MLLHCLSSTARHTSSSSDQAHCVFELHDPIVVDVIA
jgi:hypothetical protein